MNSRGLQYIAGAVAAVGVTLALWIWCRRAAVDGVHTFSVGDRVLAEGIGEAYECRIVEISVDRTHFKIESEVGLRKVSLWLKGTSTLHHLEAKPEKP